MSLLLKVVLSGFEGPEMPVIVSEAYNVWEAVLRSQALTNFSLPASAAFRASSAAFRASSVSLRASFVFLRASTALRTFVSWRASAANDVRGPIH